MHRSHAKYCTELKRGFNCVSCKMKSLNYKQLFKKQCKKEIIDKGVERITFIFETNAPNNNI